MLPSGGTQYERPAVVRVPKSFTDNNNNSNNNAENNSNHNNHRYNSNNDYFNNNNNNSVHATERHRLGERVYKPLFGRKRPSSAIPETVVRIDRLF